MYEDDEAIVEKLFRNAYQSVRPITVQWHDQDITITEIGFLHTNTQGAVISHVFSCTDGLNFYQLTFNHKDVVRLAHQLKG